MKNKVLWIEDGANTNFTAYTSPVYAGPSFDLDISLDASDGINKILQNEYAAVIVDIRIPPGEDKVWIDYNNKHGKYKNEAKLGLELLKCLFTPKEAAIKLDNIPKWITKEKFGVLTVEREEEIEGELKKIGISFYCNKNVNTPNTALKDLFNNIIENQKKRG